LLFCDARKFFSFILKIEQIIYIFFSKDKKSPG
jgi:hypothetical protein